MRNKVKYNRRRCTKYMVNRIGSTIMTLFTGIMIGLLIAFPIIQSNNRYEEVVSLEDLAEEANTEEVTYTVSNEETLSYTQSGMLKNSMINENCIDNIESRHIALSGGTNNTEEDTGVKVQDILPCAGVATVLNGLAYDVEPVIEKKEPEVVKIRCTGYCDYGVTKSGEYVRDGIIAGKDEWLGKKCNLYRINEDESIGELIGTYEFLDTGYGIKTKTANGVEGSLKLGKSVDVWHPSEESIWDWMDEYGDYVYMEGPY